MFLQVMYNNNTHLHITALFLIYLLIFVTPFITIIVIDYLLLYVTIDNYIIRIIFNITRSNTI